MVSESTTNYITVTIEKTGRDMVPGVPLMVTCGTLGSQITSGPSLGVCVSLCWR